MPTNFRCRKKLGKMYVADGFVLAATRLCLYTDVGDMLNIVTVCYKDHFQMLKSEIIANKSGISA